LKSITDTSYFPTDEIDQTNDLPVGAESGDDAKKDLAFLGYTYVLLSLFPAFSLSLPRSHERLLGDETGRNDADELGSVVTKCFETLCSPYILYAITALTVPRSFTIMHVFVCFG